MKKLITIIILATLLISCGRSKEEQMLYDYVANQLKKNINVDLKDTDFKINSIEKIAEVRAKDSLPKLQKYFEGKKKNKIKELKEDVKQWLVDLDSIKKELKGYEKDLKKDPKDFVNQDLVKTNKEDIKRIADDVESTKKIIKLYETTCEGTFLEPVLKSIKKYKANGEALIYAKYKASYSMTNPILKVKQTFDRIYYTDNSGTKFIK